MSSSDVQLARTLVDFSSKGIFPEEEAVSSSFVEPSALPAALTALNNAKAELEVEIREISRESAPDVDLWIANANSLQDDIETSRRLAGDIIQQANAEETREESIRDRNIHQDFLTKENAFTNTLLEALRLIQTVNDCLDKAEQLIREHRILDAIKMLDNASSSLADAPADKNTRAIRLLDQRVLDLKAAAHEHLMVLWNHFVVVNTQRKELVINHTLPSEPETLEDAITGLEYFKEIDSAALTLWQALDKVVIGPRTDLSTTGLPNITISKNLLSLGQDTVESTIQSLFNDLESTIRFLDTNLPKTIVNPLSQAMMLGLSARIKEVWLDTAVPTSLDSMREYQKALAQVHEFAELLRALGWPGVDSFNDWVSNVPKIWLSKKRENNLAWVRNSLSLGLGKPQIAQRIETRMVKIEESGETAPANSDWDAAWTDDDAAPNNGVGNGFDTDEENGTSSRPFEEELRQNSGQAEDADADADAWGWGEDEDDADVKEPPKPQEDPALQPPLKKVPQFTQKTITEKYWTSSIPQPILKTINEIFNEGATLLKPENEHLPVAPAAAALFVLPALILAMYRAVGPIYYGYHGSGNMFLYNDTLWLANELQKFVATWKTRDDLPPRAVALVRLDSEIAVLESFGKRAYANELNSQRTIINDLLGGSQNFFQDEGSDLAELRLRIENVSGHIRSKAQDWEKILSHASWSSSLGALVNAVATRIINDVFDMQSMSITEASNAATIISIVEELDDLFLPKLKNGDFNGLVDSNETPLTAHFADKWFKMKYLGQVLQSNMPDIKYMWMESELSLYFTAQEVIDLVELSFESNVNSRALIREIKNTPHPIARG